MMKILTKLFKKRTNNIKETKIEDTKPIYSWVDKDFGELQEKVTDILHRLHLDLDMLRDLEVACEGRIEYETKMLSIIKTQKENIQNKINEAHNLLTTIEQLKQQDRP